VEFLSNILPTYLVILYAQSSLIGIQGGPKTDTQFYFGDNFGNSAPTLTILSLLQAEICGTLIRKNWFLNLLTWAIGAFLFERCVNILTDTLVTQVKIESNHLFQATRPMETEEQTDRNRQEHRNTHSERRRD